MGFVDFFHKQGWAVERWLKANPFRGLIMTGALVLVLWVLFKINPYVGMVFFAVYALWTMTCLVCDGIHKKRTLYYERNRCKECGHFVEPKDD